MNQSTLLYFLIAISQCLIDKAGRVVSNSCYYFIICFDAKVLQRFCICSIFFNTGDIFLFPFPNIVPFPYTSKFISLSICYPSFNLFTVFKLSGNISRNFNWYSGLNIIPVIADFVFSRRSLIKMFSIWFEIQFCLLYKMLFLT